MGKLLTNRNFYSVLLAVAVSFAFVAVMASASSTISTNIDTGGSITASGSVSASSTANALLVTGQARFYNQVVLNTASSDPTGDATGAVYFDTGRRVLRVFDGVDWRTVASTTSSDGLILSGPGVRFNTVGTGYMALGTSTLPIASISSGNSLLFLNSTTTTSIPLLIAGVGGQTNDLIRAVNGVYTEVFAVDQRGAASSTDLTASGNLWVNGYATTTNAGALSLESTLGVTGATTLTGALSANGNVTLGDALADVITITGAATTSNSLNVQGVFSVRGIATTTTKVADGSVATSTIGSSYGNVLGIGTTSPGTIGSGRQAMLGVNGDVYVGGAGGTTTIAIESTTASRGGCIQMETGTGVMYRIYVNAAGTASLVVEAGSCNTGGAGN